MLPASRFAARSTMPRNQILEGDCCAVMRSMPDVRIDFVLTDPAYLVNYQKLRDLIQPSAEAG